ncbi:hypothetical protein [Microbacterium tumbae]
MEFDHCEQPGHPMTADWTPATAPDLAGLVGRIGRVQRIELTSERQTALRRSAGEDAQDAIPSLADFCPDPLVFALESGLPRAEQRGRAIDGGSDWEQLAPLAPGALAAVSRITEIVERISSAGRRMTRTCYRTDFHDARGAHVGVARGYSLDIEPAEGAAS